MIRQSVIALVLTLALASVAHAEDELSAAEAQAQVAADKGCKRRDYSALQTIMYVCDDGLTYWYFTISSANVPPGYIRRAMVVRDGATYMETHGHYDGTDAQQADFDAWALRLESSFKH